MNATTDRTYIRCNGRSDRYILVRIQAPASTRTSTRDPLAAAFVLDRSGSMSGPKLAHARDAIASAIGSLAEADRFAVVAFDHGVETVMPRTAADGPGREAGRQAVARIAAGGNTNLYEGWLRGAEQLAQGMEPGMIQRVLLLTDGHANVGVTDHDELARTAAGLRDRGITTWALGFGDGYDEALLDAIVTAGGGQALDVADPDRIPAAVAGAVGEALDVVAREVTLTAHVGRDLVVEPLSRFRPMSTGERTTVLLGELVSEQVLEVVLRVNFPYGRLGERQVVVLELASADGTMNARIALPDFIYADTATNDHQVRDRVVDRTVARIYAARARKGAVGTNRRGDYRSAVGEIERTAARIRQYAGDDRELNAIADELDAERVMWSTPRMESDLKRAYSVASMVEVDRTNDGWARRTVDPDA